MRKFRLLTADEIECRVARATDKGTQLLLYKTARTDYSILDETVGMENWQNDYKDVDGKVYCGIGIRFDDKWIWKWNCGSESNMEAEKGEASDAMKRAGFAWGLGTELYSSPFIWIKTDKGEKTDRYKVVEIGYDENQKINRLVIDNVTKHCMAYSFGNETPAKSAEDRRITIRTICTMAEALGCSDKINEDGYKGMEWSALKDDQLAEIKLWLVNRKKEKDNADKQSTAVA